MTFDRDMTDLLKTEVKVTELRCEEGLNPKYKDFLMRILNGGNLVLKC